MDANTIVNELTRLKIHIAVKGDNLSITPPNDDTLEPELLEHIKANKKSLITLLSSSVHDKPPPLVPVARDKTTPLSFEQQRLWFINQLEQGVDNSYNLPGALRLKGKLDVAALQNTFQTIVDRHESLRTTFQTTDGKAVQVIADELKLHCPVTDITESEVPAAIQKNANHIFNLNTGPLFTAELLRLSIEEHILLLNMHHIISDGWSIGVLIREIMALYGAYAKGKPSPLAPLPIQYADFAAWQRQWLQGEALEHHLNYWKQQLDGAPQLLELPTDYPRPAKQTHSGAVETFQVSKALSDQVTNLARQERVTVFMLLMTAFQILLCRYSGQTDICVGTPIANRKQLELGDLIGFFVNTLVIRTQVDSQLTFRELLQQVKATSLAAFRHQDLPFEQVIDAVNPERSLSHAPIFQVMLANQNLERIEIELPSLAVESLEQSSQMSKFDLTLYLNETDDGLLGTLQYDRSLFDADTIKRLSANFIALLENTVGNLDVPIGKINIVSENEKKTILEEWNNTKRNYPKLKSINDLFKVQVEKNPDTVALMYEKKTLTYRQLEEKANQLSRYLLEKGLQEHSPVCLCIDRSIEMIIAILGVLKAGGYFVPLIANSPPERLYYTLEDIKSKWVVTQNKYRNKFLKDNSDIDLLLIDSELTQYSLNSYSTLPVALNRSSTISNNLAYVIYTSGSTGQPKGVKVDHRAVVNYITHIYANFSGGIAGAVVSNPLSFDGIGTSMWQLLMGVPLILIPENDHQIETLAMQMCQADKPLLFKVTPSHLNVMRSFVEKDNIKDQPHCIFSGGEPFFTELAHHWQTLLPSATFINHYGPTEATIGCCHYHFQIQDKTPSAGKTVPIGRPMSNRKVYVLDENQQICPVGVVGELYVGGDGNVGLAHGYVNKPELTNKSFIENPFSNNVEDRLYKTGDLVRWLACGSLEYIGRNDFQVKIRGFRIELGEIEAALIKSKYVRQAIVLVFHENNNNKRLVAYLEPKENHRKTEKNNVEVKNTDSQEYGDYVRKIEAFLGENLPEYMVPSDYIVLDEFPLNTNGKIDRKALPEPELGSSEQELYVAPTTKEESVLCEIWRDALKVSRVGISDNFFSLGGNSLLIFEVIFKIKERLKIIYSVKDFYEAKNIKDLLNIKHSKSDNSEIISINEAFLDKDILPCGGVNESKGLENVLLTGSSGFVGRYLLHELMKSTDASVYCLVRSGSSSEGFKKIKRGMVDWEIWHPSYSKRIYPVVGDLGKQNLGMSDKDYEYMKNKIDTIVHNATYMNHMDTYNTMKPVNVDGMREIVRLACTGTQKFIHYISTTSVFSSLDSELNVVDEKTDIRLQKHLAATGYNATKWVSENILLNARDRGIASNIYRLGLITGDSLFGRSDPSQWFTRLLKACSVLGAGFDDEGMLKLRIIPVDFASKAIVKLATSHYKNEIFHVVNNKNTSFLEFIRKYNSVSQEKLKILSHKEFFELVRNPTDKKSKIPFIPFIHGFSHDSEKSTGGERKPIVIDCNQTISLLSSLNVEIPEISAGLVKKYFSSVKVGL